jgi:hypothetical protein
VEDHLVAGGALFPEIFRGIATAAILAANQAFDPGADDFW